MEASTIMQIPTTFIKYSIIVIIGIITLWIIVKCICSIYETIINTIEWYHCIKDDDDYDDELDDDDDED